MYKMQRLEVSGAVRPIYGSLGVKRLITIFVYRCQQPLYTRTVPGVWRRRTEFDAFRRATFTLSFAHSC